MPKILHTADWHLDTAFSAHFTAEQAKIRRNEMLRAVSNVIDFAAECDVMLVAGDVFDSAYVSEETIAFLKRKFAEIKNTYVFLCAGNHDPYTHNSVYAEADLGENVHIFGTEPECIELKELNMRVFGCSFADTYSDFAAKFGKIEKKEGITDIILMHSDIVSDMTQEGYNQIDKSYIENCGADYLALGHIHTRSEIKKIGGTYFAYSGPIEGRGFDECGDMGCYVVKIEDGELAAEFKKTSIRRLFKLNVDISGLADNPEIADKVKEKMLACGSENDMFKIVLTGRTTSGIFDVEVLRSELVGLAYYSEIQDCTQPDYDIAAIARQNTLCGEFVRQMTEKISACGENEREIAERAMIIGLDALLGGEA